MHRTLEEIEPGREVLTDDGPCYRIERRVALDGRHGKFPLASLASFPSELAALLGREPRLQGIAPHEIAFFDTETTGLGGAGTKIFLAGLGWLEPDASAFTVVQFFMRDYEGEAALLRALHAELFRFRAVATYNGKRFDWPLLQERLILNRLRLPLPHPHYDVLYPTRRLWRRQTTNCSLVTLESELLGHRRGADVPGEFVPILYFRFLREQDPSLLSLVFSHNRHDIVSLAVLMAVNHAVASSVDSERSAPDGFGAETEVDWLSVGRLWESLKRPDAALRAYSRGHAAPGAAPAAVESLLAAGSLLKRTGRPREALAHWQRCLDSAEPAHRLEALEELAKFEEWRAGRPEEARGYTEEALTLLSRFTSAPAVWRTRFESRRVRLLRKSPVAVRSPELVP